MPQQNVPKYKEKNYIMLELPYSKSKLQRYLQDRSNYPGLA